MSGNKPSKYARGAHSKANPVVIDQLRRTTCKLILLLTLAGMVLVVTPPSTADHRSGTNFSTPLLTGGDHASQRVNEAYANLPMSFEMNRGQADPQVRFLSHSAGWSLFLTPTKAVLGLGKSSTGDAPPIPTSGRSGINHHEAASRQTTVGMKLVGGNPNPELRGAEELPTRSNYLIGNDPARWRTNVPNYRAVTYKEVYRGVDLRFHGLQQQLEYDFIISPGGDPNAIRIVFEGAEQVEVNNQGDLVLKTRGAQVIQHKPVIYQDRGSGRRQIAGGYVRHGRREVRFKLGAYDHNSALIIDPVLSFATYLNGSSSDVAHGVAADSAGNVYVTGETFSTDFPTTAGAFQTVYPNHGVAFVSKLNATGTALIYCTLVGGDVFERAFAIAVDTTGDAYITGFSLSNTFPTTEGAVQRTNRGRENAFVTALNASGNALIYSTYLGGSGGGYLGIGDLGTGIAVDVGGNAYVAGQTNSTDFPTTSGAFQTTLGPGNCVGHCSDAFVTKLNPTGTEMLYSTYVGGESLDDAVGIAIDSSGNAYITGDTNSGDFPVTSGAFQTICHGLGCPGAFANTHETFVTKLNSSGSALVYSTYLGGSLATDRASGIAVDAFGNAIVAGETDSPDFPMANAAQPVFRGGSTYYPFDGYVTKLNADGTGLVFSTYLGGGDRDFATGVAVDALGNVYVIGLTNSLDFPTVNPLQSALADQGCRGSCGDVFAAKLNSSGAIVYSTYLGGNDLDEPLAAAVDSSGALCLAGLSFSTPFPTTLGVFMPLPPGNNFGPYRVIVARIETPESRTCELQITHLSATPPVLWPANHEMVPVTVDYALDGNCAATCTLSVSSNEPGDGGGDGHTSSDWQVLDAHHLLLRAERAGTGTGRIYTLEITCIRGPGESSTGKVTVTVPHDRGL